MTMKEKTTKPAKPKGPRNVPPIRKPADPAIVRRALRLAAETSPEEAHAILARENPLPPGKKQNPLAPSAPQIRVWQKGGAGQAAIAAEVAAELAGTSAKPGAQPVVAERPPAGLPPRELQRWHIERQINAIRDALALAESKVSRGESSALARIGPLNTQLREWLSELSKLEKEGEKVDPDADRQRWRAHAEAAVKKIRAGVKDARERMAALLGRPFPADADVVHGGPAASAPG